MTFSTDPVVHVEEAHIFQDLQTVLSDVNFQIEKGEFVFLVGRTGSGKSSLMKTLYADLPLRLGNAEVAGYGLRSIKSAKVPFLRRKVGIIFQDFQLFDDRTVADNLLFVMRATGWKDRSKMKARLTEVLIRVGLGSVTGKMPYQLSGGEQQRVVIARALINEPLILFADEPTGNLDPETSDIVFEELIDFARNEGLAALIATHNITLAQRMDRIVEMSRGRLIYL